MKIIAIWGVVSIVCAFLGGIVARIKNRDHSFWAAWSFIFWPMLVLVTLLPRNKGPRPQQPAFDDQEPSEG